MYRVWKFKERLSKTEYNHSFKHVTDKGHKYSIHSLWYIKAEKWVRVGRWKMKGESSSNGTPPRQKGREFSFNILYIKFYV